MEEGGVLQGHPAEYCHATKEDLKEDGFKITDFCPICFEDYKVRCRVANHPLSTAAQVQPAVQLRTKRSVTFTKHHLEVQAKLHEIIQPNDEKECIFYKFQFNQRGGRMAAYEWASQFKFHGKVRRTGKNVVHVLAVFVEDDTVFDRLADLRAVTSNLPEYHTVKIGLSKSYAEYLVRPFKVIKTATRHIDLNDGTSEEFDCESDLSSVSGGSSYIGGW